MTDSSVGIDGRVQVDGLSELLAALDDFPAKVQRNAVRGAIRAGEKVIADEAKHNCPVDDPSYVAAKYGAKAGALRESIRISVRMNGTWTNGRINAGGKNKKTGADVFYARWVEFGTAAHLIRPKGAKDLAFGGHFATKIEHPGAKPHPFMRPAFDSRSMQALDKYAEYLRKRIDVEQLKEDEQENAEQANAR